MDSEKKTSMSVTPIELTSETSYERLKEITGRLEQGITELFESERYREYLRVMSRFHNYSFNNTILIAMQKPDASLVASFSTWKKTFKRSVTKGENGIKIIAPAPYKKTQEVTQLDPKTQKPVTEEREITVPAFKVVHVFDVSQTRGRPLPEIAVDLKGNVERYEDFFAALEKASPVPIAFEDIEGSAHGYYHLEDKRIAIDEGMSELQTLKTAIHEIAHAKLHDIDLNAPKEEQAKRPDRCTREVQTESVAYAVCQHYGLDTSDYSFGYIAGRSSGRELDELKASLETIRSAAVEIINDIDGHFAELKKGRDAEKAKHQEPEKPQGMETPVPEKANLLEQAKVPSVQNQEPVLSEPDAQSRTPAAGRLSGIDHGVTGMCEEIAIWEIRNRIPADQRLTCRFGGYAHIPRSGVSGEMIEQRYNELRNMKATPVKDLLATARAEAGRRNADRAAVEQKPQRNERSI